MTTKPKTDSKATTKKDPEVSTETKEVKAPTKEKNPNLYRANPVTVEAFEIEEISNPDDRGAVSLKLKGRDAWAHCTNEMQSRYKPVIGDYFVIQEDGYEYINPKAVFERKYSLA